MTRQYLPQGTRPPLTGVVTFCNRMTTDYFIYAGRDVPAVDGRELGR